VCPRARIAQPLPDLRSIHRSYVYRPVYSKSQFNSFRFSRCVWSRARVFSASCGDCRPPSSFVNGYALTVCLMVCCRPYFLTVDSKMPQWHRFAKRGPYLSLSVIDLAETETICDEVDRTVRQIALVLSAFVRALELMDSM